MTLGARFAVMAAATAAPSPPTAVFAAPEVASAATLLAIGSWGAVFALKTALVTAVAAAATAAMATMVPVLTFTAWLRGAAGRGFGRRAAKQSLEPAHDTTGLFFLLRLRALFLVRLMTPRLEAPILTAYVVAPRLTIVAAFTIGPERRALFAPIFGLAGRRRRIPTHCLAFRLLGRKYLQLGLFTGFVRR